MSESPSVSRTDREWKGKLSKPKVYAKRVLKSSSNSSTHPARAGILQAVLVQSRCTPQVVAQIQRAGGEQAAVPGDNAGVRITRIGFVKPNSAMLAAICATCASE